MRVVGSAQAIRPGLRVGVPLELYDTSDTSALADLVRRWGAADEGAAATTAAAAAATAEEDEEEEEVAGPGTTATVLGEGQAEGER